VTIFFKGDIDIREAEESTTSLGRYIIKSLFPIARYREEAVSDMLRIFGPDGNKVFT
jgi:hypothetical protein